MAVNVTPNQARMPSVTLTAHHAVNVTLVARTPLKVTFTAGSAVHPLPSPAKPPRTASADPRRRPVARADARAILSHVTVLEQVRADMTSAMKAGEKERVGALRLVLSELQKAAKEGGDDELAVLRRERKRRLEAATQFRDGGRPELAAGEESEAKLIEGYLPAELDDDQLDAIVKTAIADTAASEPKDMGRVMKAVMEKAGGRVDGKRASARVREALTA